ncbi:MFS transporter [uncultured Nocardioides sp.]|uniref:MFS transporter n=1 Tax=uncultured Nocardioides sp. TaxID=198441 RepID=UPI002602B100|nr:MFS transporter [uncultured Nocardioides sp.]
MTDTRPGSTVSAESAAEPSPTTAKRAALAGGVGTLIEYYDFSVYAFLAVTLAPLFFPSDEPAVGVLLTLAVFGSAYVMRPIGGWFFGRLGDRRGRRHALVVTVVAMGVCCALLGMLPTHATVGVLAPVLLVLIRLAQGFSAGGEIGGAATYVAESSPAGRRGIFGSMTPIGSTLGFSVAAAVVGTVSALTTPEQMSAWGWRIPFLLSIPLAILCLWARVKLEDTPEFEAMAEKAEVVRSPLLQVIREHPMSVLRVIGIAIAMNGSGYIGLTYFSIYLTGEGFDPQAIYWTAAIAIAIACASFPLAGLLTDRFGRKPVLLTAYVGFLVLAYPVFAIMGSTDSILVVGIVWVAYMMFNGLAQVPAFPQFTELFPRNVRYTGVALGFNIGTIIAGGSAPYIAAQLVQSTGNSMAPAFWVMGVVVIGIVTVLTLRETSRKPLPV